MMTPQLQEALEWVNHLRTGPLRARPLDELPKGVPGHTAECVIARALKLGVLHVDQVKVNNADHLVHIRNGPTLHDRNPVAVREMIRQFDAGDLRHLIDYESYKQMNSGGFEQHNMAGVTMKSAALAKPFNKLLPKLAQFYPELQLTPHSEVEVSQSFDSMMHVVTVKNPGECPKAVELTATMVHHLQKVFEEQMQKAMCPPMVYDAGKLEALKPGSIIQMWEPVEFKHAKSMYYAPDWANMMKTPEAPVMVPIEEPTVV